MYVPVHKEPNKRISTVDEKDNRLAHILIGAILIFFSCVTFGPLYICTRIEQKKHSVET